jgi:hypothetical protein
MWVFESPVPRVTADHDAGRADASIKNAAEQCTRPFALRSLRHHPMGRRPFDRRSSPRGLGFSFRVRCDRPVSSDLVRRFPFAVCLSAQPWGIPNRPSRADGLISAHAPLFEFRRPPGFFPDDASRRSFDHQPLPWASRPYDTCGTRGPVHTGVACPPPSVLRVWLPSRRLTPSHASPALFRADSVSGVHPSELSLLRRLERRYRRPRPACRCRKFSLRPTEVERSWELEARLPGTSSGESLTADRRCLACKAVGCSPGFSPSQGFSRTA